MAQHLLAADLQLPPEKLLKKLYLIEKGYLKRAWALLFHPDPETYVTGAYIKVGYFESESEIRYHDEIHGPLLLQVEQALDLIKLKYLKGWISYDGLQRIETYPVPRSALREALLNAVIHKDYGSGAPIQIRVYKHKLTEALKKSLQPVPKLTFQRLLTMTREPRYGLPFLILLKLLRLKKGNYRKGVVKMRE